MILALEVVGGLVIAAILLWMVDVGMTPQPHDFDDLVRQARRDRESETERSA